MPSKRLRGVIAAIATPIGGGGEPDASRFMALARHLLAHGCDGLNVLGTTGEATSFSLRQRAGLMEAVAASGLPLQRMMVGTGAAAADDAAELTHIAGELGFNGALVLPPFYYKGVTHDGIVAYFARILRRAGKALPIYLYNFPALSGVAYDVELVRKLVAEFGGRIAGLKDSSGDLPYARAVAEVAPGLDVFPANEAALAEARPGGFAAGCISSTVNVNSALCARALHKGDDAALELAVAVRKLIGGMATVPAVKALLAHVHADPALAAVLPPLVRIAPGEAERLAAQYDALAAVPA